MMVDAEDDGEDDDWMHSPDPQKDKVGQIAI